MGFFLRADTMRGFYTYLEQHLGVALPVAGSRDPDLHDMSHGESLMALLTSSRFRGSGLYIFDEPESALSFTNSSALVTLLGELRRHGTAQVIVATYSPVVAAVPGAVMYELDEHGTHAREWAELDLVVHQR